MSSWAVFSDANFNPEQAEVNEGGDPWSDDAWADLSDFHAATDAKDFPQKDIFDMALDVFADDDMSGAIPQDTRTIPEVHIAIHEQLSSLYDGSNDAETQVIGSILVRPEEGTKDSFCFVVKDFAGQLEMFQEETKVCNDITDSIPYSKTEVGDRVLRVTYPSDSKPKQLTVATYTCGNVVHPIPLLVKSKVQITDEYCRVGLKMRANPTNDSSLTNGTILLAVPPDVRGESVRTSLPGSVWDSMKRVVAWPLNSIEPGELLEVQAQFEFESPPQPNVPRATPKFPVLVRCDAKDEQFSDLQLNTNVNDNQFRPIKLKLSRSVRILHRKV